MNNATSEAWNLKRDERRDVLTTARRVLPQDADMFRAGLSERIEGWSLETLQADIDSWRLGVLLALAKIDKAHGDVLEILCRDQSVMSSDHLAYSFRVVIAGIPLRAQVRAWSSPIPVFLM